MAAVAGFATRAGGNKDDQQAQRVQDEKRARDRETEFSIRSVHHDDVNPFETSSYAANFSADSFLDWNYLVNK